MIFNSLFFLRKYEWMGKEKDIEPQVKPNEIETTDNTKPKFFSINGEKNPYRVE